MERYGNSRLKVEKKCQVPSHSFNFCDTTPWLKANVGERVLYLTVPCQRLSLTITGQEPKKAKTDAKTVKGWCLLTCSLWLAQPALLHLPEPLAQRWHYPP